MTTTYNVGPFSPEEEQTLEWLVSEGYNETHDLLVSLRKNSMGMGIVGHLKQQEPVLYKEFKSFVDKQ